MIASLPMYMHAQLDDARARYWLLIKAYLAQSGIDAPDRLSEATDRYAIWTDPDLVFSRTCGMPFRNSLHGRVSLVGTPDFGVGGCAPGYYRSAIIVHKDDERQSLAEFRDAVFAFNGDDSQSGFAAPHEHMRQHGFWFDRCIHSGGHLQSAQLVAAGQADVAALDAVTWRIIDAYEACAEQVRVLEYTAPTPGLPYICAPRFDRDVIRAAVIHALENLSRGDREKLGIRGIVEISEDTYLAVPNP